ncbi:MAG: ABC transporter permease [Candidatus Thiodiazotropha sp.]|nr:ABC transporter permease [Candidatus Thiodiazotropha sp.]MCU7802524.1 ABC transporter permease [Candidatus Thiodiazotropha sp. (ex Lucinoma borealis)]MCM8883012.1 ABC transporter permease [Candidatus Thiodiazotropha sp.]MCM8918895.1 ABC transporter permease [Candidatus Thiodiazotropha sp.]MCU7868423.1 ABC transporter permease [Candidatus Thiodiazotropha sp. (ex Lucinoma borealis)]
MLQGSTWGRWLFLGVFLCIWQVTALLLQSDQLPGPLEVMQSLWFHLTEGDLLQSIIVTLRRVFLAFTLAMLVGIIVGFLMGRYPLIDTILDGVLIMGLNIPALVIIILCYVWFGLIETAAVAAVAINKMPLVAVTVREGVRAIDHKLLQVGDVFRVSLIRRLIHIYMPQLYPYLMTAARSGLSLIWKIVLVVELLGRSDGVGFQLSTFFQFFDITSILAYTLAFVLVIYSIESMLMRPLENHLTRWRS